MRNRVMHSMVHEVSQKLQYLVQASGAGKKVQDFKVFFCGTSSIFFDVIDKHTPGRYKLGTDVRPWPQQGPSSCMPPVKLP